MARPRQAVDGGLRPAVVGWVWQLWREIHQESLAPVGTAARASAAKGSRPQSAAPAVPALDWKPLVILVATALALTLQRYAGDRNVYASWFPFHASSAYWSLWSFAWWSGWHVVAYVLLPMVVIALLPGEKIRDYGWSFDGFVRHLKTYLVLFAAVMPVIYVCSQSQAFRAIYPFYRFAHRSTFDFVSWELLYAAQFVAIEFFFRGFMLNGLKRTLGVYSIWVMIVPYCMIHYGKTWEETVAAVAAGLVLGTLALRTGSIWGGVVIHVGAAVAMDLFTIQHCPPNRACPR